MRPVSEARLLLAALADLVLPASCAGCGCSGAAAREGAGALCGACAALLQGPVAPAWPVPAPRGLPPPWAVTAYAGPVRAAVLAYKEHGRLGLAGPLGEALGRALVAAAAGPGGPEAPEDVPGLAVPVLGVPVFAVPVPSSPASRRARGDDPLLRLARSAVAAARVRGLPVQLVRCLEHARSVADQAGLTTAERAANLRGALRMRTKAGVGVRGGQVVLLDDVVTTGATLAEAARVLGDAGARVRGAALVAATPRRVAMKGTDGGV